jgi:hypothetical protein
MASSDSLQVPPLLNSQQSAGHSPVRSGIGWVTFPPRAQARCRPPRRSAPEATRLPCRRLEAARSWLSWASRCSCAPPQTGSQPDLGEVATAHTDRGGRDRTQPAPCCPLFSSSGKTSSAPCCRRFGGWGSGHGDLSGAGFDVRPAVRRILSLGRQDHPRLTALRTFTPMCSTAGLLSPRARPRRCAAGRSRHHAQRWPPASFHLLRAI